MYKESYHTKIRKTRLKLGYTQEEVEQETGIKQDAISKMENGIREPNLETLGILADFYEVSVDWLLGTKGNNKWLLQEKNYMLENEIKQALNNEIEKLEFKVNNNDSKTYTSSEVLALLYSIRDSE